jgi:hypothetical protein
MNARELSEHFRVTAEKYQISTRHLIFGVDLGDPAGLMPIGAWDWIRKQTGE